MDRRDIYGGVCGCDIAGTVGSYSASPATFGYAGSRSKEVRGMVGGAALPRK
jgi:hypothetical protein